MALTRTILNEHKNDFGEVIIVPSSGGVLDVTLNDELIFSKTGLDRYPEKDEVENIVKEKLSK